MNNDKEFYLCGTKRRKSETEDYKDLAGTPLKLKPYHFSCPIDATRVIA